MWRNRWVLSVVVGIVLAGFLWEKPWTSLAGAGDNSGKSLDPPPAQVTYRADVWMDMKERVVTGTLAVRFAPRDDKVFFHLYPNAFQPTADLSGVNWEQVLGKQREPGGIAISDVRVDGQAVDVVYAGKTNTLLRVPLPVSKQQLRQTEVEMSFRLQVPYNNGRLSFNDHAMWLGNWLPILSVKDADGWRLDPYSSIGDPFYSSMANYHLRVHLPAGFQLATSGIESVAVVTETRPERRSTYELDAWNVRDFAMVIMDDTYRQTSSKVGDTTVNTWWQLGDDPAIVERLHQVASKSLAYYSEQFSAYPYKEYDVVKTGGFFGGMEYPCIVFIQDDLFNRSDPMGEAVVAHETAHQWFYGLIGNDEVREAWLDESLTDYATMAFLEQLDADRAKGYIHLRLSQSRAAEAYAARGLTAWHSVEQYPDWKSYNDLVYGRAGVMWWTLKEAWGAERLHQILRNYVTEHEYRQASGKRLVEIFSDASGADATPFFDYWLGLKLDKATLAEEWVKRVKHE